MEHTVEYYQSQLKRTAELLASYREVAKHLVATNGYDVNIEMLRSEVERWKVLSEELFEAVICKEKDCPGCKKAAKNYKDAANG